jgi:hypothetical protein
VPLLKRSFALWRELQASSPEISPLLYMTGKNILWCTVLSQLLSFGTVGALMIGRPDTTVIKGTLAALEMHNLKHSYLTASHVREKVYDMHEY